MSIKVLLKTSQPKNDGTIPIIIQVIENRKKKVYSTGYSVRENQFRPGLENWVYKHPDTFLINTAIEAKRSVLAKQSIEAVITGKAANPNRIDTFYKAVAAQLADYQRHDKVAAFTRLTTNLGLLKKAWNNVDVPLDQLSKEWVNKYIALRFQNGKTKSTVKKNLQDLATVLNSLEDYEGKNYFYLAVKRSRQSQPAGKA